MVWKILLCMLFGYLIGGINPSYIFGRIKGFDIRKKGSGNAGASNAMIIMGKGIGIFSALFDIFKATGAMLLAPLIFGDIPLIAEIAGVSCALGHIFPAYMKFKGGKGLACLGGIIFAVDPRLFVVILLLEIGILLLVDYICIVPITASIALPLIYGFFGSAHLDWLWRAEGGWQGAGVIAIASVVLLLRHVQNIRRIIEGKEMHFSYIWKSQEDKDMELIRIGKLTEKPENNKNT